MEYIQYISTVIASVLAVFIAWDKLVNPSNTHVHAAVKTQLEIRKFFEEDSDEYCRLTRSIKQDIKASYLTDEESAAKLQKREIYFDNISFVVVGLAFGVWTLYLFGAKQSAWGWLTFIFSFSSFIKLFTSNKAGTKKSNDYEDSSDEPKK